jgi:hypothetical protein
MSDGGKGDKRRPEDQEKWDNGYDRIWGNKKKQDESKPSESEQQNAS